MRLRSNRGVALLLVLVSITVVTMLAVEFAYNAQIEYHLAVRQKERLQSFYLARSAYNLTLLELKMGNAVQSQIASAQQRYNLNLPVDVSQPLCQMFPIKTALFRMIMSPSGGAPAVDASALLGGIPVSGLEDFVKFEGDFEAECMDEASKIDLNLFYGLNPTARVEGTVSPYDQYKHFLITFFSQPKFQKLFADSPESIEEIVKNIADYVDPNDVVNEWEGGQGGAEESAYRGLGNLDLTAKNGKFSTPQEIYRVAGVSDRWWEPLKNYFTIYGAADEQGNPKINFCRAPDDVVRALLLFYTQSRSDLPPIRPDNEEIWAPLVTAARSGCTGARPDKNAIVQAVDKALVDLLKLETEGGAKPAGAGAYATASTAFANWIADESRFYRIKSLGQVHDTLVTIEAVMDLGPGGGSDPQAWKLVYWKVN